MSGIYIHIPFCRQKCHYCDFYKTLNISLKQKFLDSLKKEILQRRDYLDNEKIDTIYFGGGTPSVLNEKELNGILSFIKKKFRLADNVEITFEANPDDLTRDYIKGITRAGINRLSIGVQSFNDRFLKIMNRRHNARQAVESIENANAEGIVNISLDLIYGLPELSEKEWKNSLNRLFQLPVKHLSAYHLTYHEGTIFYNWLKKGTLKELEESESVLQFNILIDESQKNGFEQYEISNFAKERMYSKHNTSYWNGTSYLGLGPSAHSFNGISRRWNISNTEEYLVAVEMNRSYHEEEILNEKEMFNEYIITRIRTKWGISLNSISKRFGESKAFFLKKGIESYLSEGLIIQNEDILTLSKKGLFISDKIMTDLMII